MEGGGGAGVIVRPVQLGRYDGAIQAGAVMHFLGLNVRFGRSGTLVSPGMEESTYSDALPLSTMGFCWWTFQLVSR